MMRDRLEPAPRASAGTSETNTSPSAMSPGPFRSALLSTINSPSDLRRLDATQLSQLAAEAREFIVNATSVTGGHLGSNLGIVELTFALHRVFDSPTDYLLFDTGHQAYVHKLITGRQAGFAQLRLAGGLSGYPSQAESEHDLIENSHASTVLSYAHGLAESLKASGMTDRRHVVAVIGDGSMTGGMAYEALSNMGFNRSRVVVVLNDNGRSYAPTVSPLSRQVSRIRLMPGYVQGKKVSERIIENLPVVGGLGRRAVRGAKSAIREVVDEPLAFFEALNVRYIGPLDGHDIELMETALRDASTYDGPIVLHVLTQKGKGYSFAEDDIEKNLHDVPASGFDPLVGPISGPSATTYTSVFTETLLDLAAKDSRVHAITAAMPGPTGLIPFEAAFPERFHDVGIAEQHAVTMAAGMAMGGLRPVVAVYSTFLTRAIDQVMYDVAMHRLPVIFCLDRAGITGEDGPSHHGIFDIAWLSKVPGLTLLAPSSAEELETMLRHAMTITTGPVAIRWPKTPAVSRPTTGVGLRARRIISATETGGRADVCILAVGKLVEAAEQAAQMLCEEKGIATSVWDVRCISELDPEMLRDSLIHQLVVTVEDGIRVGGAGSFIVDALADLAPPSPTALRPMTRQLGVPLRFHAHGKPNHILSELGLDAVGIASGIAECWEHRRRSGAPV